MRFPLFSSSPLPLLAVVLGLLAPIRAIALPEGNGRNGAKAFIIVDAGSGRILAGQEADAKAQVGSLTKVATAVVVLDWAESGGGRSKLDDPVTVSESALSAGGINSVGLAAGDVLSVRDLVYAMMLGSDNVAAEVLADHVGRTVGGGGAAASSSSSTLSPATVAFVAQMNALARSLGMERTRFLNPTGFDSKEKPFSTAADMARLTRHALGKASFRFIVAQKERRLTILRPGDVVPVTPTVPAPEPSPAATTAAASAPGSAAAAVASPSPAPTPGTIVTVRNTNELIGVKRVDGVKTGQTARAGSCLILSAEREKIIKPVPGQADAYDITQRRLIVVLLGSPDRFREGVGLLERGQGLYDAWLSAGKPAGDAKRDSL